MCSSSSIAARVSAIRSSLSWPTVSRAAWTSPSRSSSWATCSSGWTTGRTSSTGVGRGTGVGVATGTGVGSATTSDPTIRSPTATTAATPSTDAMTTSGSHRGRGPPEAAGRAVRSATGSGTGGGGSGAGGGGGAASTVPAGSSTRAAEDGCRSTSSPVGATGIASVMGMRSVVANGSSASSTSGADDDGPSFCASDAIAAWNRVVT